MNLSFMSPLWAGIEDALSRQLSLGGFSFSFFDVWAFSWGAFFVGMIIKYFIRLD